MDDSTKNTPQAGNTSLPILTLLVLIGLIAALLYIGYDSLSDDTGNAKELTNVPLDTTDQAAMGQTDNPENVMPDTSSLPVPVDLSQAPAPEDDDVADKPADKAPADDVATDEGDKPAKKPEAEKPAETVKKPEKKPESVNVGGTTSTYTVGDGETFYGIASRMNMKLSTLKALNPNVSENDVKSGVTKLRVKIKTVHTVGAGDVLRVVAQKYGVSKEAIMKANHKTKDLAVRGEKLIIPLPEKE
ncbi:LysM peptidoglycan-binding domain-containing protein [Fibrella sp. HMF5335]|uniref:LysM peptidoglycan-binding domain-containing protein n=1 Tax=Fibrella rubiginis TaxID=2817060 RepID=A0A939JZU5_9BACT|nr:LysM domain-containing protein [Fibrella rubiginis]MBO0935407.1 LysM peptidoglycan-binding domain-containing protein [Fibrella rubiginis]